MRGFACACRTAFTICLVLFGFPLLEAQANNKADELSRDELLRQFRLDDLEQSLPPLGNLAERQYFAGMLANRKNDVVSSVRLLKEALKHMPPARLDRTALAEQALADDYRKQFLYAKALDTEEHLLFHHPHQFKPDDLQGLKDDISILRILRDAPAQTMVVTGGAHLPTERNPLQSLNVHLTVNGVSAPWLIDTGANLSVVGRSFSQKLGMKPLPGAAQGQSGLTGLENAVQVALVPAIPFGGVTLHNVVVVIMEDSNLKLGPKDHKYQIDAILGYPVLRALGRLTFQDNGFLDIGPSAAPQALDPLCTWMTSPLWSHVL